VPLATGGKMALVISRIGVVSTLSEDGGSNAIWNEGCIHIRQRAQSVIITVDFERLTGPAIAAALYELADLQPKQVCLTADKDTIIEVMVGFEWASRRLCEIFANANIREDGSDRPLLSSGTCNSFEVKHQSENETYLHAS
jgi:hypothetical protein